MPLTVERRPALLTGVDMPQLAGQHVLYRVYDAAKELLYIGISDDIRTRFGNHVRNTPWWFEVCSATVEIHSDRATLELAEIAAIQSENPKYNRRRVTRRQHDGRWNGQASGAKCNAVIQWILLQTALGAYDETRKLPTQAELGRRFDVSDITVRRALNALADIGFLVSVRGHGWYLGPKVKTGADSLGC